MYVPSHFALADKAAIGRVIGDYAFAQLITVDAAGVPFVSHLPLLYDAAAGPHGTLTGHLARANPQWKHFAAAGGAGRQALAVFAGPHAYVSPSWYADPATAVPTWNYVAVHAYGVPAIIDDAGRVWALLERLVETYESALPAPWPLGAAAAFARKILPGIVAFEMPLDRIEAKAKLSQNRSAADRAGVVAGLESTGAGGDLAAWMGQLAAAIP